MCFQDAQSSWVYVTSLTSSCPSSCPETPVDKTITGWSLCCSFVRNMKLCVRGLELSSNTCNECKRVFKIKVMIVLAWSLLCMVPLTFDLLNPVLWIGVGQNKPPVKLWHVSVYLIWSFVVQHIPSILHRETRNLKPLEMHSGFKGIVHPKMTI